MPGRYIIFKQQFACMNTLLLPLLALLANIYSFADNNPYFPENYTKSSITMKQGRVLTNVQARINLVTNAVHMLTNGVEAAIGAGNVKQVVFTDSTSERIKIYTLRSGFPATDNQTVNQFYFVLTDGKCSFLKCICKRYTETSTGVGVLYDKNAEKEKAIETTESYYLFINGAMKRCKKDKDFFLSELPEKKNELSAFIEKNKTNFRNEDDVAKIVEYYNSL